MIQHHPSETTLLAYASGALAAPHAQVVAMHVAHCAQCAGDTGLLEAAGGALLNQLPPTPMAPGALARVVARLEDPPPLAPRSPTSASATMEALVSGRWRWCGPGVRMISLARCDSSNTRLDLIRIAPGTELLEHGHTGLETTLVLQGAFADGVECYKAGDFSEVDGAQAHRPRALAGRQCICIVATSGRLTARGIVGRLVRPLLGM